MGDSKKMKKAFAEYASQWGWPTDKEESKKQWKEFQSGVETLFGQLQALQETVVEAQKDAWNKILPKLEEIQEKFTEKLPEELPTPPGMPASPVSPKEVAGKLKEIQKTVAKHAQEQADTVVEFCKKGQEQVKEAVKETVKNIEE